MLLTGLSAEHACRTVYTITRSNTGGADALAAASAALAASAVAINQTRPMLAAQALTHARQLYDWASSSDMYNTSYCGTVVPCKGTAIPLYDEWTAAHEAIAGSTHAVEVPWVAYPSSSALDDLAWAGIWLHKATGGTTVPLFAAAQAAPIQPCWAYSNQACRALQHLLACACSA